MNSKKLIINEQDGPKREDPLDIRLEGRGLGTPIPALRPQRIERGLRGLGSGVEGTGRLLSVGPANSKGQRTRSRIGDSPLGGHSSISPLEALQRPIGVFHSPRLKGLLSRSGIGGQGLSKRIGSTSEEA